MTSTRDTGIKAARRAKQTRRVVERVVLCLFACLAFVVSANSRWLQLVIVIAVATALLRLVFWSSLRAYDQRRSPFTLVILAVLVCLVPPLVIPLTYDAILPTISLMRVLLLLIWVTIGVTSWTLLDRWRRRKRQMEDSTWVGILLTVAAILVSVSPPLVGLANVGKPLTYIAYLEMDCSGTSRTLPDGILVELRTRNGPNLSARSKDSEARFDEVPYYVEPNFIFYFPKTKFGEFKPDADDPSQKVMKNGDLRIELGYMLRVKTSGYFEVLGSLLSSGILEPRTEGWVTMTQGVGFCPL